MKAQIVSFHCVLRDKMGQLISSTFNHDIITHVEGRVQLLQGLTEGLQNLQKGEKRRIFLSAEQAYGFYDPRLVVEVSRKQLFQGDGIRPGNEVLSQSTCGEFKIFRVIQAIGD